MIDTFTDGPLFVPSYSLEVYTLKAKVRLDDAGRFDPRPEDILLGGDVVWL